MSKIYDLVVFDWDGTVIDSTAVIVAAIKMACTDVGVPVPSDEAARHVIGLSLEQALYEAVGGKLSSETVQELAARYRYHYLAQDMGTPLYVGAEETIVELRDTGYLLAVATGKNRAGLDRSFAETGLGKYFDCSRTADKTRSKPDPLMLHEILEELDVLPERALMIGDTTHDLQLAQNAGVPAVAMTHGAHDVEKLKLCKPLALLDDFVALRSWLRSNA